MNIEKREQRGLLYNIWVVLFVNVTFPCGQHLFTPLDSRAWIYSLWSLLHIVLNLGPNRGFLLFIFLCHNRYFYSIYYSIGGILGVLKHIWKYRLYTRWFEVEAAFIQNKSRISLYSVSQNCSTVVKLMAGRISLFPIKLNIGKI